MTCLNLASIQFFKRKITQPPVCLCHLEGNAVTRDLSTTHLSRLTSHHSPLMAPLGLIKFSIQWFWSIDTNPLLELTETTHASPLTIH